MINDRTGIPFKTAGHSGSRPLGFFRKKQEMRARRSRIIPLPAFRPGLKQMVFILLLTSAGLFAGCRNSGHVRAELVSEVRSIQPGQTFCLALRLDMDKHWHTYWKNPGDSGMPTQIAWNLPEGFQAGEIQWPFPQKFLENELVSFGYEGEIFLLMEIKASDTVKLGTSVKIAAAVDWLACRESCVPGHADLRINLPVHDRKPEFERRWSRRFTDTRRDLPQKFSDWEVTAAANNDQIVIRIAAPQWFDSELTGLEFFPEQEGIIDLSGEQSLQKTEAGYVFEIQRSLLFAELPQSLRGVLVSEGGWSRSRKEHAMQIDVALHRFE